MISIIAFLVIMILLSVLRVYLNPEATEATIVMDYTGPDLRNTLKAMLEETLKGVR